KPVEESGRGEPFLKMRDMNTASVGFNERGTGDLVLGIIASFDQDIGPDRPNEFNGLRLVEDGTEIDRLKAGQDDRSRVLPVHGSGGSLELSHGGIAVDGDQEHVCLGPRFLEIEDMTGVEDVKAAVRKGNALSQGAAVVHFGEQGLTGQKLAIRSQV